MLFRFPSPPFPPSLPLLAAWSADWRAAAAGGSFTAVVECRPPPQPELTSLNPLQRIHHGGRVRRR